jgi:hypothetical protein
MNQKLNKNDILRLVPFSATWKRPRDESFEKECAALN